MLKIKWLPRATENLENERIFIAKNNLQASIKVLQQIFDTVEHYDGPQKCDSWLSYNLLP